jgi:alpha-tubulin suppressor-like RCC1 family protein
LFIDEGTLYAWGDDSEMKHGLLGLGTQYKALRPCPNSYLFDYMVKSVSMSEYHACAVDSNGRLFTWGFGPNGELGLE